jgi:serine/threonine protein kinase
LDSPDFNIFGSNYFTQISISSKGFHDFETNCKVKYHKFNYHLCILFVSFLNRFQIPGNTNKKNDIYSFGIILFVLITGKKALVRESGESIHILQWVIPIVKRGDIQNIVDKKLQGEFNISSAWKVVEIAMSCISQTVSERPDISQVLAELKECLSLDMVQSNNGSMRARDELVSVALHVSETTILAR